MVRLLQSAGDTIDWVLITSPASAEVFAQAIRASGGSSVCTLPRIASVGTATSSELEKYSIDVAFTPSHATGASLGDELPIEKHRKIRILYPSSAKASNEIEKRLRSRVTELEFIRMNTYDTVEAIWTSTELEIARKQIDIVTFASPSAVQVWVQRVGNHQAAVCIGETSATAAKQAGFKNVSAPQSPGLEAWMSTLKAVYSEMQAATGV
jgi:uroporphyrinogen-III synthase